MLFPASVENSDTENAAMNAQYKWAYMCVGNDHAEDAALAVHLVRHKQLLVMENRADFVRACEITMSMKRQVAKELN